jgi:hypothetical protein
MSSSGRRKNNLCHAVQAAPRESGAALLQSTTFVLTPNTQTKTIQTTLPMPAEGDHGNHGLPVGDGETLPADNNGVVREYSITERSPNSMAAPKVR